jgi:hypothetical protein
MTRRIALVLVTVALAAAAGTPVRGQGAEAYKALVGIHEEFVKLRPPRVTAGVPDYTPTAIAEQRRGLDALRKRLAAIDPAAWPVPQQVDWHIIRAEMNGLDFDHRVVRPWQRDPGLYVDLIRRAPHADVPATGQSLERLRTQLQAVPRIVEQARANLTNASGELAGQAIRELEMSDGVNQGEPRRPVPPAGVIGWYRDLRERLPKHHPELVADARAALAAAEGFRDWLKQNRPAMKEPAFVGLDNYNWYLRNVRLMPYDADQVRLLGKREEDRARTFLEIEQHRNRALPPIEPVKTAEEHEKRVRDSERLIREFIQNHKLLTIPADAPAEFETTRSGSCVREASAISGKSSRTAIPSTTTFTRRFQVTSSMLTSSGRTPTRSAPVIATARGPRDGASTSRRCFSRQGCSTGGRARASCSTSRS